MAHKIAVALLRFSIVSSPICGRATRLLIVAVPVVQRPRYLHQIAIAIDASRNIAEVVVEFFHLTRQAVDGETVAEQCLNADSLRWIEGVRLTSAEPGENDCGDAAASDQRDEQPNASAQ